MAMARLQLTIDNIIVTTDGGTAQVTLPDSSTDQNVYQISLDKFSFQKKMYQPTEILADLHIGMLTGKNGEWEAIDRKTIETTFKHKKVSLKVLEYDTTTNEEDVTDTIGDDYYVHEVSPTYKADSMTVKLKIYSLDKLLTVGKSCDSFVAKKLGSQILETKMKEYKKPYDTNSQLECNITNMKVLYYDTDKEHIFPYLVQYNESFYDMLKRTCNRWGEFLYWEDGKLNIGYDSNAEVIKVDSHSGFSSIKYPNLTDDSKLNHMIPATALGNYFPIGADDSTIRDIEANKSKWHGKAKMLSFDNDWDRYLGAKVGQFFNMEEGPLAWLCSTLVVDVVDQLVSVVSNGDRNGTFNDEFFPSGTMEGTVREQYNSSKDKLNETTEIGTTYTTDKYREILAHELKALNYVVEIDYDTTWPALKLGNIIEVNGEQFIVVDISSNEKETEKYSLVDDQIVKETETKMTFKVMAIGKTTVTKPGTSTEKTDAKETNAEGTDNTGATDTTTTDTTTAETTTAASDTSQLIFYPPMLKTGHVRHSGPQKATVQKESDNDPAWMNRPKVAFEWQEDGDKIIGDISPRLRVASSDGGGNRVSRYYEGDTVMVGFVDGNIERPYVLGGVAEEADQEFNDKLIGTPGAHALRLSDGEGVGLMQLLEEAFVPGLDTLTTIFPETIIDKCKLDFADDWEYNKYFEGGFTLTDRYGVYMISGSTNGRKVEIKSPWGNVDISAFTGINIVAPNGDIKIAGKNVEIAAGNNLTLTSGLNVKNQIEKKKSSTLNDIKEAIVKKLADEYLQVLDITVIRAVWEIFARPVEGALTLKSYRFMKLEAGASNECQYPAIAYDLEARKKFLEEQQKKTATSDTVDLSHAIIKLFEGISGFADKMSDDWETRYCDLIDLRKAFDAALKQLKKLKLLMDPAQTVCKDYQELIEEFWEKGEYEEWTADKLEFNEENVPIKAEEGLYRTKMPYHFATSYYTWEDEAKEVCLERARRRDAILKAANDLRKAICEFQNYDVEEDEVTKYFKSIHGSVSTIEDYAEKLQTAAGRKKCEKATIYTTLPDEKKELRKFTHLDNSERSYLKRLIMYNLLQELGFNQDSRRKVAPNFGDDPVVIADPDTSSKAADGENSLLNDHYWNNFVESLSGVPAIKEKEGILSKLVELTGLADFKEFFSKERKENNTWGDGKDGKILFGADGETYQFGQKVFDKIVPFDPKKVTFSENTKSLKKSDKKNLMDFMIQLRKVLRKY